MFCPKCGTQLPDGAKFCGNCGAQLAPVPSAPASTAAHAAATTAQSKNVARHVVPVPTGSIDAKMLIILVLGIAALVFAFQPWIPVSSSDYQASNLISQGASALGGLFGGTGNEGAGLALKSAYSMFEIPDYVRVYQQYGYSAGMQVGSAITIMLPIWIGCVAVSVLGLVLLAVRGNRVVAIIGFVALALLAGFFSFMIMSVSGGLMGPVLCCVLSVATIVAVVAMGGKKRAA